MSGETSLIDEIDRPFPELQAAHHLVGHDLQDEAVVRGAPAAVAVETASAR